MLDFLRLFFCKRECDVQHLLVGLGNPGKSYAGHRHNIGFMALDAIAQSHPFSAWKKHSNGELSDGRIGDERVFLFKPQSYMNRSGIPTSELMRFYKIPLDAVTVFHDELDLPLAKIRIKRGGGNGGHNGLKSLDAHIGKDYQRVRLGIDHPGDKDRVSDYVLSDFSKDEQHTVEELIADISRHIDLLLAGNDTEFMNKLTLGLSSLST